LNNGKYQKDDIIVFSNVLDKSEKTIQRRINSVEVFPSYKEALEKLSDRGLLDDLLPGVTTVDDAMKIYLRNVTLVVQKLHGVVLLELSGV